MTDDAAREHYDILVLGAGSGRMVLNASVTRGRRTAIVDFGPYGGTCLNRGCIPSKMFIHVAEIANAIRDSSRFGLDARLDAVRWRDIRDRVFGRIDPYAAAGPAGAREGGIDAYEGAAHFVGPRRLRLALPSGAREVTANQVVLAVGAQPVVPEVVADSGVDFHTSEEIMRLDELPRRLIVLGGGVIGIEMASLFGALGVEITLITHGPTLAKAAGADIARRFTALARERWAVHTDQEVTAVSREADGIHARLSDGTPVVGDLLLVATGRRPSTADIGLAAAGVEVAGESGRVVVDEYGRTTAPGVWALGDVSTPVHLKHLANLQARTIRHNLIHSDDLIPLRTKGIPAAIFGDPQIAWVGQTLEEAVASGRDAVASTRPLSDTAYGWALEDTTSVCTVVAERGSGVVLGAQVMAPFASSLIQPLIDAVTRDLTAHDAAATPMWIHPAAMELVENALLDAARRARP